MRRAVGGYEGETFLITNPCETPWETVRACSTGLTALLLFATKFGGGTAASGAAIPIRLGAGASAALAFDCVAGTFPPFTTIGAGAEGSVTGALAGADEAEVDGFAELEVECNVISCGADSLSSFAALVDGSFTGAVLGAGADGAGFEAAGVTLTGFAGCVAVEGGMTTCDVAGADECPENCVQPT